MVSVENTFAFPFYAGNTSLNLDSELSQGNTFLTHTRFQPSFLLLIGNTSALPSLLASKVGNTNAFPMFFRIFPGNTPACPRKSLFSRRGFSFYGLYRKVHASFYWKDLPAVSMAVLSSANISSLWCPAASAAAAAFPGALPSAFCGGTAF